MLLPGTRTRHRSPVFKCLLYISMRKKAKTQEYLEIAFNCSPYLVVYIYLLKPSVPYLLRNRLSKAFSNSYSTLSGPMSPSICSKNVNVGWLVVLGLTAL